MTTSSFKRGRPADPAKGFTLTEVLIAAALSTIVLAGILSTFLMLVRSGVRLGNYTSMEGETRRAFEQMGIDARMANAFTANFSGGALTSFTLTIPSNDLTTATFVTYGFDGSAGDYTFFSIPGKDPSPSPATGRVNLITHIKDRSILRYDKDYHLLTDPSSTGIKHVQISVSVTRGGVGVAEATQVIRSSAFTIRNIAL